MIQWEFSPSLKLTSIWETRFSPLPQFPEYKYTQNFLLSYLFSLLPTLTTPSIYSYSAILLCLLICSLIELKALIAYPHCLFLLCSKPSNNTFPKSFTFTLALITQIGFWTENRTVVPIKRIDRSGPYRPLEGCHFGCVPW